MDQNTDRQKRTDQDKNRQNKDRLEHLQTLGQDRPG